MLRVEGSTFVPRPTSKVEQSLNGQVGHGRGGGQASNVDTVAQAANEAKGTGIQQAWTKPAFIVEIAGMGKQSATVPVSGLDNQSAKVPIISYGPKGQKINR